MAAHWYFPYEAGRKAFTAGKSVAQCPHKAGTVSAQRWIEGWNTEFKATRRY